MKEVNLKQILCEKYECDLEDLQLNIALSPSVDILLQAFKQACEQTVELCMENLPFAKSFEDSKQSILNTKTQIV